jgi:hypothetical protein
MGAAGGWCCTRGGRDPATIRQPDLGLGFTSYERKSEVCVTMFSTPTLG